MALTGVVVACGQKNYEDADVETFAKLIESENVILLDVRSQQEYADGHISGALNIDQAQGDFTQALGRLMVADENYPELRDLKAFQDVRDKLSGAVNRLAEARRKYNEQAKVYNVKVQTFPNNILAGMFGFQPMFYYEAPAGTEEQTTDFSRK